MPNMKSLGLKESVGTPPKPTPSPRTWPPLSMQPTRTEPTIMDLNSTVSVTEVAGV